MILSAIYYAIYGVLFVFTAPIRLLPQVSTDFGLSGYFATAGTYLAPLSAILPLTTIFAIISAFVLIETGILTYKGIRFTLKLLKG